MMASWECGWGLFGERFEVMGGKASGAGGSCGCLASCSWDLRLHPAPLPPSRPCRASPHTEAGGAMKGPLVPLWVAGCCDRNMKAVCPPPPGNGGGAGSAVVVGLEAAVFPHPAGWGG